MPGASVRSRGNLLTVAPLPPVLPPSGVRHQPQIPYSTAIPVARPRGFEPLTFGSVVAKNSPETRTLHACDRLRTLWGSLLLWQQTLAFGRKASARSTLPQTTADRPQQQRGPSRRRLLLTQWKHAPRRAAHESEQQRAAGRPGAQIEGCARGAAR